MQTTMLSHDEPNHFIMHFGHTVMSIGIHMNASHMTEALLLNLEFPVQVLIEKSQ